ncbi:MAG: hypothetical protein AAF292_08755 [Pseudomonadota bacterium]
MRNEEKYARFLSQDNPQCIFNAAVCTEEHFTAGLLYWRWGKRQDAFNHLNSCVKGYNQFIEATNLLSKDENGAVQFGDGFLKAYKFGETAAALLEKPVVTEVLPNGYETHGEMGVMPWFDGTLIEACVTGKAIDSASFEQACETWTRRKYPKTVLEAYRFYFEFLTGKLSDLPFDEVMGRHEAIYESRKKFNKLPDLMLGEGKHNPFVVDWLFALILKSTGWEGRYLHAWIGDGFDPDVLDASGTTTLPHKFVAVS